MYIRYTASYTAIQNAINMFPYEKLYTLNPIVCQIWIDIISG